MCIYVFVCVFVCMCLLSNVCLCVCVCVWVFNRVFACVPALANFVFKAQEAYSALNGEKSQNVRSEGIQAEAQELENRCWPDACKVCTDIKL